MNTLYAKGRLMAGIGDVWELDMGAAKCGCFLIDIGPFWITWVAKNCICLGCRQHVCECPDDGWDEGA